MKRLLGAFVHLNRRASERLTRRFPGFFTPPNSIALLERELREAVGKGNGMRILECGGIDRPLLARSSAYRYDGLDIETQPRCGEVYDHFYVQSVEDKLPGKYDLIISRTLVEHVPDNHKTWSSICDGLAPGGTTIHYIPCKNHPYSLATRIVGNKLQRALIGVLRPEHAAVTGYKTHFHLCTPRATRRELRRLGLRDVKINCFWDAEDYFTFFVPAFVLMTVFNHLCRGLRVEFFASGMVVSARKAACAET